MTEDLTNKVATALFHVDSDRMKNLPTGMKIADYIEYAGAAIRTIRESDDWQPIATAPKDRKIWAVLDFRDAQPKEQHEIIWTGAKDFPWSLGNEAPHCAVAIDIPTHWRELPKLPGENHA